MKLHLKQGLFFLLSVSAATAAEECCTRKTQGEEVFDLVEQSEETVGFGCFEKCVYTIQAEEGSRYCFKMGGGRDAPCQNNTGSYHILLIHGGMFNHTKVSASNSSY